MRHIISICCVITLLSLICRGSSMRLFDLAEKNRKEREKSVNVEDDQTLLSYRGEDFIDVEINRSGDSRRISELSGEDLDILDNEHHQYDEILASKAKIEQDRRRKRKLSRKPKKGPRRNIRKDRAKRAKPKNSYTKQHAPSTREQFAEEESVQFDQSEQENPPEVGGQSKVPIFIIAGTQKSGSTVLAGYLAHHPQIAFAKRKELHFFDKNANYDKGIDSYFEDFDFLSNPNATIIGEATPYYTASRTAFSRIAQHFPHALFIVILREPVARAYSEYQMKARRIEDQNDFLSLLVQNKAILLKCMTENRDIDLKQLTQCLPKEISQHGRMGKLRKALTKTYDKVEQKWVNVVSQCFFVKKADESNVFVDQAKVNATTGYIENAADLGLFDSIYPGYEYIFDARSCWEYAKEGYEFIKPIEEAFIGEMEAFSACHQNLTRVAGNPTTLVERLKVLDNAINTCIKVVGGISRQYFYRSLYVAQLVHSFKVGSTANLFAPLFCF
jgi:hypothetical protein